jgi:hypothetical protein
VGRRRTADAPNCRLFDPSAERQDMDTTDLLRSAPVPVPVRSTPGVAAPSGGCDGTGGDAAVRRLGLGLGAGLTARLVPVGRDGEAGS